MISKKFAAFATAAALVVGSVAPAAAYPTAVPFRPNVAVISIWAGTASVILDAMYIAATQCREMTQQEASLAILPVVGPVINAQHAPMSRCTR